MKRYAVINLGYVDNIVLAMSPLEPSWIDITDLSPQPGPGWQYLDGLFIEPPASVPEQVSRTLTHLQFRSRFTQAEQEAIDELEVVFESSTLLSREQKRSLRTGYKNFYAAAEVNLDDPAIPTMLALYVALGYLAANRPAEILT